MCKGRGLGRETRNEAGERVNGLKWEWGGGCGGGIGKGRKRENIVLEQDIKRPSRATENYIYNESRNYISSVH